MRSQERPSSAPAVAPQDDVIACLLSEREAAIRGEELAGGLFAAVEEVAELPDGYAYRYPGDDSQLEPLLCVMPCVVTWRGCDLGPTGEESRNLWTERSAFRTRWSSAPQPDRWVHGTPHAGLLKEFSMRKEALP